jgi:hypothetical protein
LGTDEVAALKTRINKLELQGFDEYATLLEIMSNATFFGDIKRANCEHANQGQCTFFILKKMGSQDKIPIAAQCRVKGCTTDEDHYHLEVSNVTCALCPLWQHNGHFEM